MRGGGNSYWKANTDVPRWSIGHRHGIRNKSIRPITRAYVFLIDLLTDFFGVKISSASSIFSVLEISSLIYIGLQAGQINVSDKIYTHRPGNLSLFTLQAGGHICIYLPIGVNPPLTKKQIFTIHISQIYSSKFLSIPVKQQN